MRKLNEMAQWCNGEWWNGWMAKCCNGDIRYEKI